MRVAVTGNIGSGKSTFARLLEERGARLVDADALSRRVVDESAPLKRQLADAFGEDLLDEEGGHLDRRGLARRALVDGASRRRLEGIVRPHLQPVIAAELAAAELASPVVVLDAPLVFEWGIEDWFARVFVISADADSAVARVAASRDMSVDEVRQRHRAQFSDARRPGTFEVVDNNGSLDDLRSMADKIWNDLTADAGAG